MDVQNRGIMAFMDLPHSWVCFAGDMNCRAIYCAWIAQLSKHKVMIIAASYYGMSPVILEV